MLIGWISRTAWLENRPIGDANDDRQFDSSDLVKVFQAGEYEDRIRGNSTFDEGDWNGDGDFDTKDLVRAFQAGTFVFNTVAPSSEIAAAVDSVSKIAESRQRGPAFIA